MTATGSRARPTTAELSWEAPGPGSWQLLADHFPRPVTAASAELARVWSEETTAYFQRLGLPIGTATQQTVNGLPYLNMGGGGGPMPPAWLFPVLTRVVPSLRRAERSMRSLLADQPWVAAADQWYGHDRDVALEVGRTVAAVDPTTLDDEALAEHVERGWEFVIEGMRAHIALHEHDSIAPGLFVVQAIRWGLPKDEAIGLLRGSSPASTGRSAELDRLRDAVAGRPADSLDDLRSLGDEVSAALDELLLLHGWRLLSGYDIDCPCLAESPSLVVALATTSPGSLRGDAHRGDAAAPDPRIPEVHRREFDRLLAGARLAYGLRDDNSSILLSWRVGLARRAWLAAGERLVARGAVSDRDLVLEATAAEVASLLRGRATVGTVELGSRADHRRTLRAADAPAVLGPPEAPVPTGVGGALGLVFEVFSLFDVGVASNPEPLCGTGVGAAPYTGTVRLVDGTRTDAVEHFNPGDVLVAPMTSPSYNLLLSLAGAVVTEAGGLFSHAAIMARELGLPAVIGAPEAMTLLRDGDVVTVDPVGGEVRRSPSV
jgi:rifampicin phosphotransferase